MKKYLTFSLFGLILFCCTSKYGKNDLLISFSVMAKSPEKLYKEKNFKEEEHWDIPFNINTTQKNDTLLVKFEIFEGNAGEIIGDIDFSENFLFLKINKSAAIKELVINEYKFKIFNPTKKSYEIQIENKFLD